jgi:hypothetical protein
MEKFLAFAQTKHPAHLACRLNLNELYGSTGERKRFDHRFESFLDSDPINPRIYRLEGDRLSYRTEHLVPGKEDGRTPLLLIFGNPASHSITSGMFFSPKKDGEENRFWGHLLGRAGIEGLSLEKGLSKSERNQMRMTRLISGDYKSDFRVGLCVYVSMPSSAGGPWSGVAGIRKLLGKRAFDQVAGEESERVSKEAARFLRPKGFGVTFQKEAWIGLSSSGNYSLEAARAGTLKSTFKGLPEIPIFGAPPTRLLGPSRTVLRNFLNKGSNNSK